MKVIVREVCCSDWVGIYLNDDKVLEGHHIETKEICEELQRLITHDGAMYKQPDYITYINGEYYYVSDAWVEENDLPEKFSDIPEAAFE